MNRPRRPMRWRARAAAVLFAAATCSTPAFAQVYKCTDAAGKTTYADSPCSGASAPMRLPADPARSSTSPTACAQLEDELHRLDAQVERDANRGRKESAAFATRRRSLGKQYADRCMGIARSTPQSK